MRHIIAVMLVNDLLTFPSTHGRAAERLRVPMILSNPEFSSNPFETIRKHAQNTLLKHEVPK